MQVVRHQAIGTDAATLAILPFPQVRKAMPIIAICEEKGLPVSINKSVPFSAFPLEGADSLVVE